ncbi:general secretion pathway protein GspM [Rhodoblastus acidophilus]|uniref:General secretion pathway protein GspM n=1 Tax=Candidatus Rhodoblastus alkanivorans TaxID=2954117 RepID=A0ABS9ZAZ4_9HYPH|nr:type II secretion system protein GspM [Candidatus Rhodoblastus alkanivorans]MCI4677157.1 general secretion pathway protein GspM [Candidatus Rhodoblastus alkanivorans]MCI4684510.1 general secretion pathway protein GspM [Candidatus Rhodoblastus alkanivorans]MDI4641831.1 general secretion pathway protein GspM [Rhodoblastus acidophilus]
MNWRALMSTRPSAAGALRPPALKFWLANGLILAALYLLVVQPIRAAIARGEEALTERRATLARYEAVAAQAARIENYAKSVAAGNDRGQFIAGDNDGIVAANLQTRLKAAADGAKVSVRSLQALPSKTLRGSTLFGARLEVGGTIGSVRALVRDLEGGQPVLVIGGADLRGQTSVWGAPEGKEPEIEAAFDVFGAPAPHPPR